jgi:hypothetical protein
MGNNTLRCLASRPTRRLENLRMKSSTIIRLIPLLAMNTIVALPAQAALTFNFNYIDPAGSGFNANEPLGSARRAALQQTATLVSNMFPAYSATISMDVNGAVTEDSVLAAAGSNNNSPCIAGFQRPDVASIVLGGTDPAPGTADGTVSVNFEDNVWHLGDTVPANEFDFKSTMAHELLHALGFSHSIAQNGQDACSQSAPTPGSWAPFDQHLGNNAGLFINGAFVLDTAAWTTAVVGGTGTAGILWRGPAGTAANNNAGIPLFSPTTFSGGSTGSHLDDDFFTTVAYLMEAATGAGPGTRTLSAIEQGIMNDIGYQTGGEEEVFRGLPIWLLYEASKPAQP